jgi:alpha-galactosidase
LLRSKKLAGSHLALVAQNAETLALVHRLADRLNGEWKANLKITSHTRHQEALSGASFVVSAIEVPPRERLWRTDWEIPLRHGVRQPYAENGGPGGFAHAARNIGPVLKIAHDMEQACPDAWFINYTNPMVRICDAIHRYSKIKAIGLCHQIYAGYGMVGYLLADKLDLQLPEGQHKYWEFSHKATQVLDIKAAGLNHFTWMLDVRDRRNGEDLYPLVRERWAKADPAFQPLTQRVLDAFGWMPIPADGHLCEYLPWVSDPITKPWEKYNLHLYDWEAAEKSRHEGHKRIALMGEGKKSIARLKNADSEGALEMIEAIAGAGNHYHLAVNLPNYGQITNLPEGAIVETPGLISGLGARGFPMGDLPEAVAELLRQELARVRLSVDAAATGNRQAALQCLLLDPVLTDIETAKAVLADYLTTYRQYLPQFWQ